MYLAPQPQFVSIGDTVVFVARQLPSMWSTYCSHAEVVDEQSADDDDADLFVAGVCPPDGKWPSVLLALAYEPGDGGFAPGLHVVPETGVMFVGAGTTLRAYRFWPTAEKLWEDAVEFGFFRWRRHGATILMSAELELAAWDITGTKLWSRYVEPPWDYTVDDQELTLDVMGAVTTFDMRTGP
jgi:hypothetical protein